MPGDVYEVKSVIRDILADRLPSAGNERVDIFYGWKEADSPNRFIVVGDTRTIYNPARVSAQPTLARYDLDYQIGIYCASGLYQRTEEDAERQCYELMELVLDALVRGDATGQSELARRVGQVVTLAPVSDEYTVRVSDAGQPMYSVVRLMLAVQVVRS